MPIRVVCFDLGGVIVRICAGFAEAVQAADLPLREASWLGSPEALAQRRQVILDHQVGLLDFDQYCQSLSEATRGLYSPSEVRRLHIAWLVEEYPGAHELISELGQRGIRTACLSNTNDGHWAQMHGQLPEHQGFRAFAALGTRLASHLLRVAKPDLAIYRAAEKLFDCAPDEIVFFDDLPENIAAAREAGWHAVQVDPSADPPGLARRTLLELAVL